MTQKDVYPISAESLHDTDDMTKLNELHQSLILHNIRQRYNQDTIYVLSLLLLIIFFLLQYYRLFMHFRALVLRERVCVCVCGEEHLSFCFFSLSDFF